MNFLRQVCSFCVISPNDVPPYEDARYIYADVIALIRAPVPPTLIILRSSAL